MKLTAALLLGCGLACWGPAAWADPRLDEVVYSPWVQRGTLELESRVGHLAGGPQSGAATEVVEVEYGFTDRFSLALLGAVHKEAGASSRADSIGLESVIYLGQVPGGVDTSLYLEAKHGLHGKSDGLESKLLFGKQAGRFSGLLNLIVERPIGPHADEHFASYGYAASATWRTVGKLQLGVEAFGDLGSDHAFGGRQGAYIGPQVKWEARPSFLPAELEFDVGWLAAVVQARREANSQLKLNVELERQF
jgi:hypothetical protein